MLSNCKRDYIMKGRFLFSQHHLLTNNFVTDFEKIRTRQDSKKMSVCRQSTLNKTLGSGGQKKNLLPGYPMGFALNTFFDCFKNLSTYKIKKKLPSFQIIVNDISRHAMWYVFMFFTDRHTFVEKTVFFLNSCSIF